MRRRRALCSSVTFIWERMGKELPPLFCISTRLARLSGRNWQESTNTTLSLRAMDLNFCVFRGMAVTLPKMSWYSLMARTRKWLS